MSFPFWTGEPCNEHDLVIQAQAGDTLAFNKLYNKYYGQIYSYATRKTKSAELGDDIAQETFTKAWYALPSLRDVSAFASWLYRIATNLMHDHQRQRRKLYMECYDEALERDERASTAGPEEQVEVETLLETALRLLPKKYRACFIWYHFQRLPMREIAKRLDIEERSVKTYLSEASTQLRQIYRRLSAGDDTF